MHTKSSRIAAFFIVVLVLISLGAIARGADDVLVTISGVTGSNGGDRYANGMVSITNGSGIAKANPLDASTWTFSGSAYADEWMAWYLVGALNSKLAWASFDLGTPTVLSKLWIFNNNYGAGASGTQDYNLYYADSPSVSLPAQPAKNTFSVTGLTPQGDYDFNGGGWTKLNSSGLLTAPQSGITSVDLSGVTARYVAVEIITNHGDTYGGGRVGFDEVALTLIPPPAGTVFFFQ